VAPPPTLGPPESLDEDLGAGDDHEVPSGTRRVSRLSGSLPRPHAPKRASGGPKRVPGRERPPGRMRGPHSRAGRVVSLIALLVAAAVIWFIVELFQPFHGSAHGRVTVAIPAHSSSSQVGDQLEREGVISSSFFFQLRATLAGERGDLRPGTYHLQLGMGYGSVLGILTKAPPAARVTELTVTPGRTRRQISALLHSQGVRGSYFAASRRSRLLDPHRYGAPRSTNSLEGFLYPDTYQLREPVRIADLVHDQLQQFRQQFATVDLRFARRKHLTPYDVVIIASMVEAEAQTARDRPLVASVIYNRLAAGMPLQIDATTRYATGNYTRPLTASQLNSNSPYNTRIRKGLTPTPIDNPALASIQAAAHPSNTNYLYFVVKPCGNGEQVFTSSYAQFLTLAQQYQAARAKRGGRSPAHC
jgi:peptidoglycan lytic transglycosylase G